MNDLIKLEDINASELFKSDDEVYSIIKRIEDSVYPIVSNVNTAKGRKEIASIANKVSRSKTYIDGLGKDLVADAKKSIKEIDNRRKTIRDRLDKLKDDVRSPLTEYENAEEQRLIEIDENLSKLMTTIEHIQYQNTCETLDNCLNVTQELRSYDFQEFAEHAARLFARIDDASNTKRSSIIESERLAIENDRLRKQAEEAERKEREAKIAENARREAEEREKREHEAKIEAQRQALESEKRAIEAERRRQIEAEEARKRAIEAEKAAKIEAERRAKESAERARLEEIKRQEAVKEEEARLKASREADEKNRAMVNQNIVSQLIENGVPDEIAINVVEIISAGKIDKLSISY